MTALARLNAVREKLTSWLATQGYDSSRNLQESLLIKDGFYCGRRFRILGFSAVWFAEEDELKVFDDHGTLLARFALSSEAGAKQTTANEFHKKAA